MILPKVHCLFILILTTVTRISASEVQHKPEDGVSRSKRHLFLHHQRLGDRVFPHSNRIFQWVFGQNDERNPPLSFAQKFFLGSAENGYQSHTRDSLRLRPILHFPISEGDLQIAKFVANVHGKKYCTTHQNVVPTHGATVSHHHHQSTVGHKSKQNHHSSKSSNSQSHKFRLLPSYQVPIRFSTTFDSTKPSLVRAKNVIKTVYGKPVVDANIQNRIIGKNSTKHSEQHSTTLKTTNSKIHAAGQSQQKVDEIYQFHLLPKFAYTKLFNSLDWQKFQHTIQETSKMVQGTKTSKANIVKVHPQSLSENPNTNVTYTYSFKILPRFVEPTVFGTNEKFLTANNSVVSQKVGKEVSRLGSNEVSQKSKPLATTITYYFNTLPSFKNSKVFQNSDDSETLKLIKVENTIQEPIVINEHSISVENITSKLEYNQASQNSHIKANTFKILPNFQKSKGYKKFNNGEISQNSNNPSLTYSYKILPGLENSTFTRHDVENSKNKTSKLESNNDSEKFQSTFKILPDFQKHSLFAQTVGRYQQRQNSVDVEQQTFKTIISQSNSSQSKDEEVLVPASSSEQNYPKPVFVAKYSFKTGPSAPKTKAGSSKNSDVLRATKQSFVENKFNTFKDNKLASVDRKPILSNKAFKNDKISTEDTKNSNVTKNGLSTFKFDEYEVSRNNITSQASAFITLSQVIKKYEEGDFSDSLNKKNAVKLQNVGEQSKEETSQSLVNERVIYSPDIDKKVRVKVFKRPVYN